MYRDFHMSKKKLFLLDGNLVFPPSETCVVRDITLYINVFMKVPVLVQISQEHVDLCYQYMKSKGVYDFCDEIVYPGEEDGYLISSIDPCTIKARKLWAGNMNRVIDQLNLLSGRQRR